MTAKRSVFQLTFAHKINLQQVVKEFRLGRIAKDFLSGKFSVTVDSLCAWPIRMLVDGIWGHLMLGHLCQGYWERCSVACGKILTSSPLKSDPLHLIHSSLRPPESTSQIASRLVQPFFAGLMVVTDRQTDRPRFSVCSDRQHLASAAMWLNNICSLCYFAYVYYFDWQNIYHMYVAIT